MSAAIPWDTRTVEAVRTFDTRVRSCEVAPPVRRAGVRQHARKACHPFVTTEADFQRWFGAALEEAHADMSVHAEVYAYAHRERGQAARCDLSVHARTREAVVHDDVFRRPALLVELKMLTVGGGDRAWTKGPPSHVGALMKGIARDVDRAAHAQGVPLVTAVFLEPLAYELDAAERTRRQALISTLFASASLPYTPVPRADGFDCCVALLTSTSSPEVL